MNLFRRFVLLACLAAPAVLPARAGEPPRRNWFDDPFEVARSEWPGCPPAMGPFMTEAEARGQAHHRVERGNSCVLDGTCDPKGPYAHDKDINRAVAQALRGAPALAGSTIAVTTVHRWVTLEGCVRDEAQSRAAEALARAVPQVQAVIVQLKAPARQ